MTRQRRTGYVLAGMAAVLMVMLVLAKVDYDRKAAFSCEVIADNPEIEMEQCPYHQNNSTSWLLLGSFALSALILAAGVYLVVGRREEDGFKEVDVDSLEADERKVYEALRDSEGSMYQSDLVKETGLSKVKTTRVLDRLEQKGIAERKRRGMTNLVVLK